jgi:hypothetical protein
LDDFKENFDPYTGVGGTFDIGLGWRWLIGGHFIINASIVSGLYLGDALSATTLPKLASAGIPAVSGKGFPFRLDAAIAFGWAFFYGFWGVGGVTTPGTVGPFAGAFRGWNPRREGSPQRSAGVGGDFPLSTS